MSATVTLHPHSADLFAACEWAKVMIGQGYDVRPARLARGHSTITAYCGETASTNSNVVKRPRYAGQFGKAKV